jgi:tetratricopeptide (TPR) repeat protein
MPDESGSGESGDPAPEPPAPPENGAFDIGMAGPVEFGLPPMVSMAPVTWLPAGAGPVAGTDPIEQARMEAAAGDAFYAQGQFSAALYRFREAVALRPSEAQYHYKLARAARRAEDPQSVEAHLLEAIRIDSKHAAAHNALGLWYRESGKLEPALRHTAEALAREPGNGDFAVTRASVLSAAGQTNDAWDILRPLVAREAPGLWPAWLYAQLAPKLGREHEERAAAAVTRALQAPDLSAEAIRALHFAAAALLDQMGRYDEAFAHARRGNETFSLPHDPAAQTEWVNRRIRYFTKGRLRALPRATHRSRRPVFIVGMPRTGTTLVEQILASHPQVYGAGELTALAKIAESINDADWREGQPYPECLDSLTVRRANRLAAEYLSTIESLNKDAIYVTDKMPLNVMGLELVELLLPGCRVIHCVRDPVDTCVSCYLTGFAAANEFSFDLAHLGHYYRDYRRLVDHYKRVLALPMLEVRYEDVVFDVEEQARRMLEFLDLPWDERCLRFYENQRRVATASEDQVRRPVYTSSVGRWKNYEKHLPELLAALGRGKPPGTTGAAARSSRPSPTARCPAFAGLY